MVSMSKKTIMQSTVDVVKAYVAGNKVPVGELPRLVKVVSDALTLLEKSTDSKVVKARKPAMGTWKPMGKPCASSWKNHPWKKPRNT